MRRLPAALALLAGLLVITTPTASAAPSVKTLRVMPLGDSITAGVGSPTSSSYRRPLAQLLSGQTRYAVNFVGSQASGNLADLSNEGHSGWIIDQVRAEMSKVATFNAAIKAALTSPKTRYVEPPALTSAEMADGLHPNDAGFQRMAQAFYPALDRAYSDGVIAAAPALNAGNEAGGSGKVRWADFDGDGRMDYLTVASNGAVQAFLNRGGDGRGGWSALGQVATGVTTDGTRVRFADFDGDSRADYLVINANGSVSAWLNRGGDGRGGWSSIGQVASGVTTDQSSVRFTDFTGDGNADYAMVDLTTNAAIVYSWAGGDGHGGYLSLGQVATGVPVG